MNLSNFEIPSEVNTYLHRSGRTGRMNKSGTVVTLGDDHDFRDLKKLLADTYQVQRAYFAGYSLTTEKPKRKKEEPETQEKKVKESQKDVWKEYFKRIRDSAVEKLRE